MSLSVYSLEFANLSVYVCVCVCVYLCLCWSLSCVQLFSTPWIVTCQASLFVEFSRQEYWSGYPFPTPGDLLDPGLLPAGRFFTIWATMQALAQKSKYYGRTSLVAQVLRLSTSSARRGGAGRGGQVQSLVQKCHMPWWKKKKKIMKRSGILKVLLSF